MYGFWLLRLGCSEDTFDGEKIIILFPYFLFSHFAFLNLRMRICRISCIFRIVMDEFILCESMSISIICYI